MMEDASGWRGEPEREFAPANETELRTVLCQSFEQKIHITFAGSLTGVTGGAIAEQGWSVSMKGFNRITIEPGKATVGAGVSLKDLQEAAQASGQFFAPDPTEHWASVGGIIANNASGSRSFLYGSTRSHVLALRVMFSDGEARTFRRGESISFAVPAVNLPATTKHQAGYPLRPDMDWIDLIVGSEGTLCVVLEAELALLSQPGELFTGVIFFPDDGKALDAVEAWRSVEGLRMLEYLDAHSVDLLRSRFKEIPEGASCLLIEQLGDDPDPWLDRLEQSAAFDEVSWFALGPRDREKFRQFRHALPEIVNDTVRRNGFQKMGSDYAVPISRNREMMAYYRRRLDSFEAPSVIFGHIGDAHVHVNLLPASQEHVEQGRELMLDFAKHAVLLGGSVGAEHGLGKRKRHLLDLQFSAQELAAMRAVKLRLDPHWLLGAGNLWPVTEA